MARRLAMNNAKQKNPSKVQKKSGPEMQAWEAAGLHCSANERRADEASRDVEAWLKCKYMREHLGEEFSGTVTSVAGFGVFVTLDQMYVEGLIHITELGGEYYNFDEIRQELRGERTGIRYAIGTKVRVQVSRVDLDGRKIDFRLVTSDFERFGGVGLTRGSTKGLNKSASKSANSTKSRQGTPAKELGGSKPKAARGKSKSASAKGAVEVQADASTGKKSSEKVRAKKSLNQVLQTAVTLKAAAKKKKGRKPFRMS